MNKVPPVFPQVGKHLPSDRVRFGQFELNVRTGELYPADTTDGSQRVLLREQPFQILRILIERGGKIVTRDEIKAKLWPNDTIVDFGHSINVAMGVLRRALGDSADSPRYIETLARRGYRLLVDAEWLASGVKTTAPDPDVQPAASAIHSPAQGSDFIGRKVSHYRVLEIIGGGGMGMVYKAEDLKLGRRVALKFLPEEFSDDPLALRRFQHEAQTASALNHPNICTIYEIEEYSGQPFIVMELLEGDTLQQHLEKVGSGPMALNQLLDIAIQICNGLEAAHQRGVIHRDIKPPNIYLTSRGQVKILDFGLAKLVASEETAGNDPAEASKEDHDQPSAQSGREHAKIDASLTRHGITAGTAAYMSPEQVRKEKLDARTDLFSFGMVLYEMAAGRRAFEGETVAEIHDAILHQMAAPAHDANPNVSSALDAVISKALEKDRERRYQSADEMREDLVRARKHVSPARRRLLAWTAGAALAVIFAGVAYTSWRHFGGTTPPRPQKIMLAVLPFENLTGDPNKEYLADGLTEETISQLGRLNPEQLGVIARTSVMGYKHKDERLDQIGRDLSVQYVLENSLRQSENHIRLTAQLIQVKDQTHLWSHDYDYSLNDFLNVEDEVAKAVAHEIRVRLTSQQQAELTQRRPVNPEAFDAYLQGYYHFERDTDKDTDMAAKYYERATQLDPSYALAWVGLSRARNWQVNTGLIPAEEGHRLAREAVERALALNPNLAEAHTQMGRIKQQVDFDWAGAHASFQRAVVLEPGDPDIVRSAASSAAMLGRFDEGLPLARRAVDLDPLNANSWYFLGETEFFMGQLDEAAGDLKKALQLSPDVWFSHGLLSQIYITQGRPQDALPEIELVPSDWVRAFLYPIAYHALSREKESDAALSELIVKYHAGFAYQIAQVYAFRNQSDEAFEWLDRAYAQRDSGLIGTKVEPLLKSLHNDPRFAAFLKKLNLPN
jgi:serine/threonine protein kinase/TolB-like protein